MSALPRQTMAPRAASPAPAKSEEKTKDTKDDTKDDSKEQGKDTKGGLFNLKSIVIVVVLGVLFYVASITIGDKKKLSETLEKSVGFIEEQGAQAVLIYCAVTVVGVVCLVPTTPLEMAGGFLFSPKYGVLIVLAFTGVAKLIANVISVLIARHLLKDWVMKTIVAKYDLLKMVALAVKDEPWKMVFLVRGSMVPLSVKNYGLGVMEVGYLPIAVCSTIFSNFYAFQNIYMGAACQNLKEVFAPKKGAAAAGGDWMEVVKKCLPIAFNFILIIFLVKAVKGQVKKQKNKIEAELKAKNEKKSD